MLREVVLGCSLEEYHKKWEWLWGAAACSAWCCLTDTSATLTIGVDYGTIGTIGKWW